MALPNIFQQTVRNELINRINQINTTTSPEWGKMNAGQMLAHLNVMFELALEEKHQRPNAFVRFLLKKMVKDKIVNEKPYARNSRTAPEMVIKGNRDVAVEKQRLLSYLQMLSEKGEGYFNGREHPSFGLLSITEWNNAFYKHIDHHLTQFGC